MKLRHDKRFLRVVATRCDECLYSKNKIVTDESRDQVLAHCDRTGKHFVCHKASIAGVDAMCKAHWDQTKHDTLRNRLAQQLGAVRFVTLKELAEMAQARGQRRR